MVRVLIVEDDPMARTLFELYLKHSGRYELAAAIESASMAELYCLKNPVNLIIMDGCTALKASGLTAAAKIKKNSPGIRIVLVTSQPEIKLQTSALHKKRETLRRCRTPADLPSFCRPLFIMKQLSAILRKADILCHLAA